MKHLRTFFVVLVMMTSFLPFASIFAGGNIVPPTGLATCVGTNCSQFLDIDLDSNGTKDRINWSPTNTSSTVGVTVTDTALSGHAWGESVGWINMSPSTAGVKNTCNGDLSGNAWGENTGWVNFGPFVNSATPTVKIDTATGKFGGSTGSAGYAWAQNYGWIKFDCSVGSDTCVQTTWMGCAVTDLMCTNKSSTKQSDWVASGGGNYVDGSGNCLSEIIIDSTPATCTLTASPTVGNPGKFSLNWTTNISSGNYTNAVVAGLAILDPDNINTIQVGPITGDVEYFAGFRGKFVTGVALCSVTVRHDQTSYCPNVTGVTTDEWLARSRSNRIDKSTGNCVTFTEEFCSNEPSFTVVDWINSKPIRYANGAQCLEEKFCPNQPSYTIRSWPNSGPNRYVDETGYCTEKYDEYCPNISPQISKTDWENQDPNYNYVEISTGSCEKWPVDKVCYNLNSEGLDEIPDGFYGVDENDRTCLPISVNPPNPPVLSIGKVDFGWVPQALAIIGLMGTIPGFATRLLNLILAIPFYRRKRPWGVVYDSMTKETLDPAYVSVFDADTGQLIDTRITDINGRYGFLLPQGNFRIKVQKTNYEFPSKLLPQKNSDGVYDNLYFGDVFSVTDESRSAVITLNIPMDRLATDWNQEEKKRLGILRSITKNTKFWSTVSLILFVLGFIFSAFVLTLDQSTWNVVVFILYVIFALLQITGNGTVSSGTIKDAHGNGIAHAVVRVWNSQLGTEISKRVTDENGQYYILVAKGDYYVTIDAPKENTPGEYDRVFTSGTIRAVQGVINEDFKLS